MPGGDGWKRIPVSSQNGQLIPCNQQKISLLSDKNSLFR